MRSSVLAIFASLLAVPAAPVAAQAPAVPEIIQDLAGSLGGPLGDQPQAVEPQQDPGSIDLTVDAFERIDLHVTGEQLATVLRLLSIETERNIVIGPGITAEVTADLYRVGFYEALGAILRANGLAYVERDGFIFVHPAGDPALDDGLAGIRIARVIDLHYLNAEDAARLAQPLLSEGGSITSPASPPVFQIPEDAPVGRDEYAAGAVVVVHDFPDRIDAVEALLRSVDRQPQQVLIEATILQATIDEANAWGVDFSVLADLELSQFTSPLGTFGGLFGGAVTDSGVSISSDVGNTGASGGVKVGVLTDSVAVFVRALDEVTDVTTISRPKLLTLNRQAARVLVGTRVGYLDSTTATQTTTVQQVAFLDTGTQLRVRPFIMENGQIRLELRPQVSSATLRTTAAPAGGSIVIPDEDTTELVTNLIVADGQTVVLGGLFTEMTSTTRRQAPGLGDIPLLGAALRGHDDTVARSEIIFLIRPTILDQPRSSAQGLAALRATEQARLGARRGLLPWSREKRVGQLLIDAENLRRRGDTDRAIDHVERALGLSPTNGEAARLRDRLLGEEFIWPEQSVLESIMRNYP